jgi:hypothetical protein
MIERIRDDLRVLRVLADNNISPTDAALSGLWRHFGDIELVLPLPVMSLTPSRQHALSRAILAEMDAAFIRLAEVEAQFGEAPTTGSLADVVNQMWREYAGTWAEVINAGMVHIPTEIRPQVAAQLLADLRAAFGDEDAATRLREDTTLRMSIRRSGLDPDALLADM